MQVGHSEFVNDIASRQLPRSGPVACNNGDMKMLGFLGSALMVLTFMIVLAVAGLALLMVDLGPATNLIAGALWAVLLAVTLLAAVGLLRGKRGL